MEDLAHFIQSMSEKYGLLDASHKQHQQAANSNNNPHQQQQQQHLQDHTSSAASNTLNSEECPGSSWECLSVFISGSQSIDCKTAQSGPHHALYPSSNPKNQPLLQQQVDSNGNGSPPLHCFSKLIDIDEHECPPLSNASQQQQQESPPDNDLTSHLGASPTVLSSDLVQRGTIFDSCGDLSTIVTMPDYIQQCCHYPRDDNNHNNVDGAQTDTNFCPGAPLTKNSRLQQLHQSTKNAAVATNSSDNSTEAQQEMYSWTKGNEGSGGVPSKDSKEVSLYNNKLFGHDDKNSIDHGSAIGMAAASVLGQGLQTQQARSRLGLSSTSAGLNTEAESGEYDEMMALQEYEIPNGRTSSRETHTGTDTEGCGHEGEYQNGAVKEGTKGVAKTNFGGRSNSRGQCHAAASFDGFQSFDFEGEHHERGTQVTSRCSCSSTEMLPSPTENGHHHEQGKHGTAAASSSSLDYLPISSVMQSRVAQLDEASKELFASSRNSVQNSNQLNLTLGLLENEEFRRESSTSSDKPPVLKKARSFRDFSNAAPTDGNEDRLMQKGNTAPSVKKNSGDLESNNNNNHNKPGVSMAKSRQLPDNHHSFADGAKSKETWEKDEGVLKGTGMEGVREPKWSQINKLLCENGFSPVDWQLIITTTEIAERFFYTLNDVVRNYRRREKEVQDLLAERESFYQEEKRSNEIMQKLEYEAELVKRKLATSEQRAELANAAAEKSYALLRKDNQRLEASHATMLQRCSQLEHGSRAKERALRKLQEKIQEAVQREERQRQKEKELYEMLKHKIAIGQKSQGEVIESNFLLRDLKPATIVGIYERQRARAQVEMNCLREENSRLCQELCEKENSLLSKMQAKSTADVHQSGFDKREHKLFQQLTEIDDILKTKVSKMTPGGDTALLPVVGKHSPMDAAQGGKSHRVLQETLRKQLDLNSSSTLLARNFDECTSLKCEEFLRGICNQLKVENPARITGAIDGLLKVVAAVPRMETFIEQVCDVVFNDGAMMLTRYDTSDMEGTPGDVPGILKSWLEKLQCVEELQQFKDSVSTQLWERFDEKAVKHPMSSRVAAASVKDLIETERQYVLSQASYREGDIVLKAEPQKLLHCMIKHFQMLFEISQLEGVMAVMNSVYIQISEYHNFARALCSMLGLPKDARPNSIISTITSILNKG